MSSVWLYVKCDICGDEVPVALEHEGPVEALEIHKRALHPGHPEITEADGG